VALPFREAMDVVTREENRDAKTFIARKHLGCSKQGTLMGSPAIGRGECAAVRRRAARAMGREVPVNERPGNARAFSFPHGGAHMEERGWHSACGGPRAMGE
jgi:hypothetical protein